MPMITTLSRRGMSGEVGVWVGGVSLEGGDVLDDKWPDTIFLAMILIPTLY